MTQAAPTTHRQGTARTPRLRLGAQGASCQFLPGPIRVTSRTSSRAINAATSLSSCSRPRNGVAGTGRFDRYRLRKGGNTASPQLEHPLCGLEVPSSGAHPGRAVPRPPADRPWPQEHRRRRRHENLTAMTSRRDPSGPVDIDADVALLGGKWRARVHADPYRNRATGQRFGHLCRRRQRAGRSRERDEEGVSLRVNLHPTVRGACPRTTPRCSSSASAYPWLPNSSSTLVDPSTSVNTNVTVPLGSSTHDHRTDARATCDNPAGAARCAQGDRFDEPRAPHRSHGSTGLVP